MRGSVQPGFLSPSKDSTPDLPLVRAVLCLPDGGLRCDECQAWLPAYVDAEIGGISDHPRYLPVKRHLLLCPSCEETYLELMEMALAEQEGRIPPPARYPQPDLSFLPEEDSNERPREG